MTGPLQGLKVLDLTTVLMGPYTTQILADMGADVIKVESSDGDPVRQIGPYKTLGMGPQFLQVNRGKRSIVLDLKSTAGKEVFVRLAAKTDILITSMRPKALARLGLDYSAMKAIKSDLIYVSLTGYGENGPYSDLPAYDDLIQAATGLSDLYVKGGGAEYRYMPVALADRFVGVYAVGAVLAAAWSRERTGEGQKVDVPMFETMAQFVLGDHFGGMIYDPPIAGTGYHRLLARDRRPYATKDGHVAVLIYSDGQWKRFLTAVGRGELMETDPRFSTMASRTANIDAIYQVVAEVLAEYDNDACMRMLREADIPSMPLHSVASLIEDEHLAKTGFIRSVIHPSEGNIRMTSVPARFAQPTSVDRPAPRLGEHTRELMLDLGYSQQEIDAFLSEGSVQETMT